MARTNLLAGSLALALLAFAGHQTSAQSTAQQPIPDAPKPQTLPVQGMTPGIGTTPTDAGFSPQSTSDTDSVPSSLPSATKPQKDDGQAPFVPPPGQAEQYLIRVQSNLVEVPFTVKDSKGNLVAGLTWRDVRVYENGLRQHLELFTTDPLPLSVAIVIDQSMTYDNMTKVNNALSALQGAFAPYDQVAVFTYNNGPRMQTAFTGSQSARLTAVLERSKSEGREPVYYDQGGPLSQNINLNGGALAHIDPNTNSTHGRSMSGIQNVPREPHTLNDAILAAATEVAKSPKGYRRVVYVISDGREYGSQASTKEVIKFLQHNKTAVYGTLIGDSSLPVIGFLNHMHLPLSMRDNVLPAYTIATGGNLDGEFRQKGIEQSFARIMEEVRTQYTVTYYTHEPFIDGKYRTIEVKIMRPNLTVIAKKGYYPTAADAAPTVQPTH